MLTGLESLANARALIVDDNPINRQVMCAQLQPVMPIPGMAADMAEAITMSRRRVFDLLLLDLHLQDGSGDELLRNIRNDHANPSREALAVAVSADPSLADPDTLAESGFQGVLIKPVDPEQLFACLQHVLSRDSFHIADSGQSGDHQVLNDQVGLASTGQDPELLAELRQRLALDLDASLPQLESAMAGMDTMLSREILHRIAGGAAYCGAGQLQSSAVALHAALKNRPGSAVLSKAYLDFHSSLNRCRFALARCGHDPTENASMPGH